MDYSSVVNVSGSAPTADNSSEEGFCVINADTGESHFVSESGLAESSMTVPKVDDLEPLDNQSHFRKSIQSFVQNTNKMIESIQTSTSSLLPTEPFLHLRPTWNTAFATAIKLLRTASATLPRNVHALRFVSDTGIPKWVPLLPSGISCHKSVYPPGEWYYPTAGGLHIRQNAQPESMSNGKFILYFHGGAFCLCSTATHRGLLYQIAQDTGSSIFSVDYRRPPEYPVPYPVEDCLSAYLYILEKVGDSSRIIFAGDSAGGNLVISTMLRIHQLGLDQPAGGVLLSPWVDLSDTGESNSWIECSKYDYIDYPSAVHFAQLYRGESSSPIPSASGDSNKHNIETASPVSASAHSNSNGGGDINQAEAKDSENHSTNSTSTTTATTTTATTAASIHSRLESSFNSLLAAFPSYHMPTTTQPANDKNVSTKPAVTNAAAHTSTSLPLSTHSPPPVKELLPLNHPDISPLFSDLLHVLPPLLCEFGACEVLHDQILRFCEKVSGLEDKHTLFIRQQQQLKRTSSISSASTAQNSTSSSSNVAATNNETPTLTQLPSHTLPAITWHSHVDMVHVFPIYAFTHMPQCDDAFKNIVGFVNQLFPTPAVSTTTNAATPVTGITTVPSPAPLPSNVK